MKYQRAFSEGGKAEQFIYKILSAEGIAPYNQIDSADFPDGSKEALYVTQVGLIYVWKQFRETSGTWLVTINT